MQNSQWQQAKREKELVEQAGKIALKVETPNFNGLNLEQVVLGAMLMYPEAQSIAFELLDAECFQDEPNQIVWGAMAKIKAKSGRIDLVTVSHQITLDGQAETANPSYLFSLADRVAGPANTEYHCQILLDTALRRNLNRAAFEIIKDAKDGSKGAFDVLQSAKAKINNAETKREKTLQAQFDLDNFILSSLDGLKETGLDVAPYLGATTRAKVGLLGQNQVTVLAGRPGSGKTSLGLQSCIESAKAGLYTVFVTYEMTTQGVYMRAICQIAEIEYENWELGRLSEAEKVRIKSATAYIKTLPFKILDLCGQDVNALCYKLKEMNRAQKIDFIAVDYLGMIPRAQGEFFANMNAEVAYNSAKIRDLAKLLDNHILLMVQMSRASDKDKHRLPVMSDLRDSGTIEQDAHRVIFVHRPEYFGISEFEQSECTDEGESTAGKALLVIRKNRTGKVGIAKVAFQGIYTKFAPAETFDFDALPAVTAEYGRAQTDNGNTFDDLPF